MKMHEELDKEYNEKMNRARLEHAYMEEPSAFAATVFLLAW